MTILLTYKQIIEGKLELSWKDGENLCWNEPLIHHKLLKL